jgi:hypothetical protein
MMDVRLFVALLFAYGIGALSPYLVDRLTRWVDGLSVRTRVYIVVGGVLALGETVLFLLAREGSR